MGETRQGEASVGNTQKIAVADMEPGMRVRMYRTVVEITGKPYGPPGMLPGWLRVPMIWDGVKCAPPERGSDEFELEEAG
jgi:hypothetical protein